MLKLQSQQRGLEFTVAAVYSVITFYYIRVRFMLRRKKPKMLKKRRIMDVSAVRRRIKRCVAVMKLHRRQRNYQTLKQHETALS
jgi:hypothetical protein